MRAIAILCAQILPQLTPSFTLVPDVDVDLQLVPADQPGTVRRPDLLVVTCDEFERVRAEGGLLRASEVAIAVEILSPGSLRTDRLVKRDEYADAGIPNYWILDLDEPVSLLAHHLAGDFGYQESAATTGVFETDAPFPLRIDLDSLI